MKNKRTVQIFIAIFFILSVAGTTLLASGGFVFSDLRPVEGSTVKTVDTTIRAMVDTDASIDKNSATVTLNGTTYSATFTEWYSSSDGEIQYYATDLVDGSYNVEVAISDVNGNIGTKAWQFQVLVPPVISELTPQNNSSHQTVDVISAKAVDPNGTIDAASIVLNLNGSIVSHSFDPATGYITYVPVGLSDGQHNVSLSVKDSAGNPVSATWSFKTDNSPPTFSSLLPASGGTINNASPTISVKVADTSSNLNQDSVRMYLNGQQVAHTFTYDYNYDTFQYDYQKGTVSYKTGTLTDDTYQVRVEVSDAAGNVGEAVWEFTVAVPPAIQDLVPADNSKQKSVEEISAVVTDSNGTVDPASIVVKVNSTAVPQSDVVFDSATGKVSVGYPGGLAGGTYTVYLEAADNGGNKQTATWSFKVSNVPPQFTNFTPASGATVDLDNPKIEVRIEGVDGNKIESDTVRMLVDGSLVSAEFNYDYNYDTFQYDYTKGTLSFTPSSLSNSVHDITVEATDDAGNQGQALWSFTVAAPPKILEVYPAPDASVPERRSVISVDLYSNDKLSPEDVTLVVYGKTVTPEWTELGDNTVRLSYQPKDQWLYDQLVPLELTALNTSGLQTTQQWSYTVNVYGEMPGTGKDISTCTMCHDGVQIKQQLCGDCHSYDIDTWQSQCFDCHLTEPPPYQHHRFSTYPHLTLSDHKVPPQEIPGCRSCHSQFLSREHNRNSYTCATCHENQEPNIEHVIATGGRDCLSCHTTESYSLVHPDHNVSYGNQCMQCHGGSMIGETVYHGDRCETCHVIGDETVSGAIKYQSTSCFDCHSEPHGVLMTTYKDDIPRYDLVSWGLPQDALIWLGESWLPEEMKTDLARVVFSSRAELNMQDVNTFYKSAMEINGWTLLDDVQGTDTFILKYSKGNRYCYIWYYSGAVPETVEAGQGARLQIAYH